MEEPSTREGLRKGIKQLYRDATAEKAAFSAHISTSRANLDTELDATAEGLKAADHAKTIAEKQIAALSQQATTAQEQYRQLTSITGPALGKNGVTAKLRRIGDAERNAGTIEQKISEHRDQALVATKKISDLGEQAAEAGQKLGRILADSNGVLEDLQETYKLAVNVGLAGALLTRKRELRLPVYGWLVSFMIFGLAAVGTIIDILVNHPPEHAMETFLIRGLLVTPTLLLSVFSYTQYKHERRLWEEYSFRAALAQSLESYTKLLSAEFKSDKDREKILGFVVASVTSIYDRSALDAPKSFLHFGLKSPVATLQATIREEAGRVKQSVDEVADKVEEAIAAPPKDQAAEGSQEAGTAEPSGSRSPLGKG
jgi:hypothetical protein